MTRTPRIPARKQPPPTGLTYRAATSLCQFTGALVARRDWLDRWLQVKAGGVELCTDGVVSDWEPTDEDREAEDWGVRW